MDKRAIRPADLYITGELARRKAHRPDFLREKQAIQALAARMAEQPEEVLPKFIDLAVELTGGTSAGLSLLEPYPSPGVFRWCYLQGSLAKFENETTPRDFSPCGIALDINGPLLALHPERYYTWISEADIIVPEVLLVPLYVGDSEPMGTLWIVAEREGHFDGEHARIAGELASFVGIAIKVLRTERSLQMALQEQEMLTNEMAHRVKNLFAVSSTMVRMASKTATSKEDMAQILTGRFRALASAHGLIRRSFSQDKTLSEVSNVAQVLRAVLKPLDREISGLESRFSIAGPTLGCGEHALNGIALVFHELAINALKYGALSVEQGTVEIRWATEGQTVTFLWSEHNGPATTGAPQTTGFGSKLLRDTVEGLFRGSLSYAWNPDGLCVQIEVSLDMLAR